jgi:DNA polymerase-4
MNPLRWLYLDLNSFFASVEQQLNPALRGRPVAIGPESIDSGTVIAASYEAKAFGVRTGMRVGEAKCRCPGLVFTGSGHGRYVQFHDAIVAEVWRHIPVTAVCSIDEVACRLLDNENSRDQAIALARRIKAGIRANVGDWLTASVGIAPSRLLAKIAADMKKPDGLTVIESADLPRALLPLPLSDIPGIGRRMERRLAAKGIHSMTDLLASGPDQAASAWGSVMGSRMWHALHGSELPERPQKSRSIGHSHVLAPAMRSPATAHETARRLLLKAATRLRRGGFVTRSLTLHARFESRAWWSASERLAPTDDSFPLLRALGTLWPRLEQHLGEVRVRTIGISLDDLRPATGTQYGLFEPPDARTRALCGALDRIEARFGRDSVQLGPPAEGRSRLIGAKIAFGRIPEPADFAHPTAPDDLARSVG